MASAPRPWRSLWRASADSQNVSCACGPHRWESCEEASLWSRRLRPFETEVSAMEDGVQRLTKVPAVVFGKFPDAEWTLPGLTELVLHPITPRKGS